MQGVLVDSPLYTPILEDVVHRGSADGVGRRGGEGERRSGEKGEGMTAVSIDACVSLKN